MEPLQRVSNAVREPYRAKAFLYSRLQELNVRIGTYGQESDGIDVMAEDWDVLVLLDAARYDITVEEWDGEQVVESRRSRGTHSEEFIRRNFEGRELYDTVYVTANPYATILSGSEFHHLRMVGEEYLEKDSDHPQPERVTERALEAADEFPNKRLIVHYMQPHYPYLGPTGQSLPADRFWQRIRGGQIDEELLHRSYRENLRIALGEAQTVADSVRGNTVISADHGELLGDPGRPIPTPSYIHPPGYYHEKLTSVPWIALDDKRRRVTSDPPVESVELDEGAVEERLSHLGYK